MFFELRSYALNWIKFDPGLTSLRSNKQRIKSK